MTDVFALTIEIAQCEEELRVVRLDGREAISRLFRFDVDVNLPAREPLPASVAPGAKTTIKFWHNGEQVRQVHGIVEEVKTRTGERFDTPEYRLRVVPRAAGANLVRSQSIFMGETVTKTIGDKLALAGVEDAQNSLGLLRGNYEVREFVVQYRETDYAFISRLAEDAGISFYFDHDGIDRMVFADSLHGFTNGAQAPTIRQTRRLNEPGCVYELEHSTALHPSTYVVYDYNYRRPEDWIIHQEAIDEGSRGAVFEYGAHAKTVDHAEQIAKIRAEEVKCRHDRYRGTSSIVGMAAGGRATLESSEAFDGTELLVTSVRHLLESTDDGAQTLAYRNRFRALGTEHTFRPKRRTPKPRIDGIVTGIIQGAPGHVESESPYLDEEGRYIVQFHFDWASEPDQRASRRVRMAQPFGGKGTDGMQFPLKPGAEVVLAFIGGDPDRPIIVGAMPNATQLSPVGAKNAGLHKISTADGIIVQFGKR